MRAREASAPAALSGLQVAARLWRLSRGCRGRMLAGIALGALTIASGMGLLVTSAWLIAAAALRPSIADLQVAIVGVRFFGICRALLRYAERLAAHDATLRLLARLRVAFYRALEPLAPAGLEDLHSGDLLERVVGDVDGLQAFYLRVLRPPAVAALTALLAAALLAPWDPLLAVVPVAGMALAGLGVPLLGRRLRQATARQ
ncbi:MAG: thiol reductant ABC exporter subunit CydC, partial [Gemmatimonadota bacterium]